LKKKKSLCSSLGSILNFDVTKRCWIYSPLYIYSYIERIKLEHRWLGLCLKSLASAQDCLAYSAVYLLWFNLIRLLCWAVQAVSTYFDPSFQCPGQLKHEVLSSLNLQGIRLCNMYKRAELIFLTQRGIQMKVVK
jgi:hypothetical protein